MLYHAPTRAILFLLAIAATAGCGRVGYDNTPDGLALPAIADGLIARYMVVGDGLDDVHTDAPTGTCSACPVPIIDGERLAFDFADAGAVEIIDDGRFAGAGGFSVSAHVKPIGSDTDTTIVSKILGDDIMNSHKLSHPLYFETSDGSNYTRQTPADDSLPLDTWSHLLVTWDGASKRFYVDGVEVDERSAGRVEFDDGPVIIGADQDGGVDRHFFDGALADVRLYNRALAADEAAIVAAEPRPRPLDAPIPSGAP